MRAASTVRLRSERPFRDHDLASRSLPWSSFNHNSRSKRQRVGDRSRRPGDVGHIGEHVARLNPGSLPIDRAEHQAPRGLRFTGTGIVAVNAILSLGVGVASILLMMATCAISILAGAAVGSLIGRRVGYVTVAIVLVTLMAVSDPYYDRLAQFDPSAGARTVHLANGGE